MTEAVIVSTARTGLAKSWRDAFNMTHGATPGSHAVQHAIECARIELGEVEDILMGCANPEGATGTDIARQIAPHAGCPVTVPGVTVNYFRSLGLQIIAMAARRTTADEDNIFMASGVEPISYVWQKMNCHMMIEGWLNKHKPGIYWNTLQTVKNAARRYNIAKERMDEYSVQSQQHVAVAAAAGEFSDEIVPMTTVIGMADAKTDQLMTHEVTVSADEDIRADTTLEGVSKIHTAMPDGVITAGDASRFPDGVSTAIVINGKMAATKGLQSLGVFHDFTVASCEPSEMDIGPASTMSKLLKKTGLKIEDIGLWELNEAFAVQVLYCVDKLGVPMDRLNANGSTIAVGYLYGVSGACLVGHALIEGKRRSVKHVVVAMCIGGGQGVTGLFEVF